MLHCAAFHTASQQFRIFGRVTFGAARARAARSPWDSVLPRSSNSVQGFDPESRAPSYDTGPMYLSSHARISRVDCSGVCPVADCNSAFACAISSSDHGSGGPVRTARHSRAGNRRHRPSSVRRLQLLAAALEPAAIHDAPRSGDANVVRHVALGCGGTRGAPGGI